MTKKGERVRFKWIFIIRYDSDATGGTIGAGSGFALSSLGRGGGL
jgi:hypothetical protein